MRWYTAVGVKMEHPGGLFCVQVGTENKILSGMEIFIWNALLWSFVEETQIYGRMVQLLKAVFPEKDLDGKTGKDEFNFCFRRLITRGLITFCECETEKEAAENLLQNAIVARVMRNSGERFLMFCESFACGTPFWKALFFVMYPSSKRVFNARCAKIRLLRSCPSASSPFGRSDFLCAPTYASQLSGYPSHT